MAGLDRPESMDGRSIMPLLVDQTDKLVPAQTRAHVAKLAPNGKGAFASAWRDHVFIEYYFNANNAKCGGYNTEDIHNNFIGIRHMVGSEFGDTSYAEYMTGSQSAKNIQFEAVDFVEYFNLTEDTWQMNNLWNQTPSVESKLSQKLHLWFHCRGNTCM